MDADKAKTKLSRLLEDVGNDLRSVQSLQNQGDFDQGLHVAIQSIEQYKTRLEKILELMRD